MLKLLLSATVLPRFVASLEAARGRDPARGSIGRGGRRRGAPQAQQPQQNDGGLLLGLWQGAARGCGSLITLAAAVPGRHGPRHQVTHPGISRRQGGRLRL